MYEDLDVNSVAVVIFVCMVDKSPNVFPVMVHLFAYIRENEELARIVLAVPFVDIFEGDLDVMNVPTLRMNTLIKLKHFTMFLLLPITNKYNIHVALCKYSVRVMLLCYSGKNRFYKNNKTIKLS